MPELPNPNPRAEHDDSLIQGKNWFTARINRFIDAVTPKCRENVRIISRGMDAPLPLSLRLRLRLHFVMCCYCHRYEKQLRDIRMFSRHFPEVSGNIFTAALPAAAKERIKQLIRREFPGK
jgi:hypothetical protein